MRKMKMNWPRTDQTSKQRHSPEFECRAASACCVIRSPTAANTNSCRQKEMR
jgi:hypothetical protein